MLEGPPKELSAILITTGLKKQDHNCAKVISRDNEGEHIPLPAETGSGHVSWAGSRNRRESHSGRRAEAGLRFCIFNLVARTKEMVPLRGYVHKTVGRIGNWAECLECKPKGKGYSKLMIYLSAGCQTRTYAFSQLLPICVGNSCDCLGWHEALASMYEMSPSQQVDHAK